MTCLVQVKSLKKLAIHAAIAALFSSGRAGPILAEGLDWVKEKELTEQAAELRAEAETLIKGADEAKRSLNEEERKRFDEIEAECKRINDLLADANKLAKWRPSNSVDPKDTQPKGRIGRDRQPGDDDDEDEELDDQPRAASIRIPAQARFRHTRLTAYKGEHAEKAAYIAGQFILATLGRHEPSANWCRSHGIDTQFRGAMSGNSNSLGGYLVPIEMEQSIIDLRQLYGVFRREARVEPMASDTKTVPVRSTGLTAYFSGDNVALTESEKTWSQVSLIAKKVHAMTRYSSELSEDSVIDLANDLTQEIAHAFSLKEDQCGFLGDGTSTYGGIVGLLSALLAGSTVDAGSGNTGFETLDLTDFEKCIGKLPEFPGIDPKWYIHKAGWAASMARLQDAAGGNTNVSLAEGPRQMMFLGYPVVFSQVLNSTLGADASAVKCYFGDLDMSVRMGNRRGISVMLSDQRYFEQDQIAIKGTERFDINVHSTGSATEPGAVVALKTASG